MGQTQDSLRAPLERITVDNLILKAILAIGKAILLPATVFVSGVVIMRIVSGHHYVNQRLRERAAPEDRSGLNMRPRGYDAPAVNRHWGALDARALDSERRFLQVDLAFPIFYGAAFAVALLRAGAGLGASFSPVWFLAPVAVTVIADWSENLIHLAQLRLFTQRGSAGLQADWIRVASTATIVKLLFFWGTLLLLILLAIYTVLRPNEIMKNN